MIEQPALGQLVAFLFGIVIGGIGGAGLVSLFLLRHGRRK